MFRLDIAYVRGRPAHGERIRWLVRSGRVTRVKEVRNRLHFTKSPGRE